MRFDLLAGQLRRAPVIRVRQHRAHVLDHPQLHGEQVLDRATLRCLLARELDRAVPGFVGGAQTVQRVHQRVATGQRSRDQIRLVFHLARQRALRQHHAAEDHLDQRTDRPDDQREDPPDPGDPEIDAGEARQERIQRIALGDDMARDLLRDVDPAAHCHRALREMAELVRQHRFQFAEAEHVDQPQPDLEVLARGEDQVGQRKIVEHAGIDMRGQVHASRPRCARLVGQTMQELEQFRLLAGIEFEVEIVLLGALVEDQRLEHEDREEGGASAGDQRHEAVAAAARQQAGEQPVGGPREPGQQAEIDDDEGEQAQHREPGMAAVVGAGIGEAWRYGRGAGGIEDWHDGGSRQC